MFLKKLSLQNFRLLINSSFEFHPQLTLIIGPNAIGKTSLIEAIQLLANGNSFRAKKIEEMINFSCELARAKALVKLKSEEKKLEILLTRGQIQGKRTHKTHYSLNEVKKRKRDFVGEFLAVSFRPEDMRLVEGSPYRRRQFVDGILSLLDYQYAVALKTYEQALKKRNRLLWQIKEGERSRQVLSFFNLQLVKHGTYLQAKRREFFNFANTVAFPLDFLVKYLDSPISEDRQEKYLNRAIAAGHSLIGPHKDDFQIELNKNGSGRMELAAYGSRGQQRLGVLWLKLIELKYLQANSASKPVLLLDDILSELDEVSKEFVLAMIKNQQTIITSADKDLLVEFKNYQQIKIIEL